MPACDRNVLFRRQLSYGLRNMRVCDRKVSHIEFARGTQRRWRIEEEECWPSAASRTLFRVIVLRLPSKAEHILSLAVVLNGHFLVDFKVPASICLELELSVRSVGLQCHF